jgi:citrate lyase beta subunit
VEAAERASADLSSGAFTLPDGQFVDVPIIQQARDILLLSEAVS